MLVESGDSSVLVRFRSDYSHAGRGFRLEYSAICDTELTGLAGTESILNLVQCNVKVAL